jgi:hypothetical protein
MTSTIPEGPKPDQRAEFVRQLLALAEFIEKRDDLPLPDRIDVQHSIVSGTIANQQATVTEAAGALGVEVGYYSDNGGLYARYHDSAGFSYSVAATYKHASDYVPEPTPVAEEIGRLSHEVRAFRADNPPPVFTAAGEPLPELGGPSHPDVCGAVYAGGHGLGLADQPPCIKPPGHAEGGAGKELEHSNGLLKWTDAVPPRMSTDFPGTPFGRGDTITVLTGYEDPAVTE